MTETVVVAPTEQVAETAATAQAVSEAAATERTEICETAQTERAQVAADAAVAIAETEAVAEEEIDALEENVSLVRQDVGALSVAQAATAAEVATLRSDVTEIKTGLSALMAQLIPPPPVMETSVETPPVNPAEVPQVASPEPPKRLRRLM